jgi:hypothetical protein
MKSTFAPCNAAAQAITDNARSCLRNASVEYAVEVLAPGVNCSTSFGPAVSLMKLDNGQLVGNGQEQLQGLCSFANEDVQGQGNSLTKWNERLTANVSAATLNFKRTFRDFVEDTTVHVSGAEGGSGQAIAHLAEDSYGKVSGYVRLFPQGEAPAVEADVESTALCGGGGTVTLLLFGQLLLKGPNPQTSPAQAENPFENCADPFAKMWFPIEDGATYVTTQTGEGGIAVWTATLHFDVDQCDQEQIAAQCDQEAKEMIRVCQTLKDWEVVEQIGKNAEPQVTCGSPDCTEVIERNEAGGKGPFTSITKEPRQCM